MSISHAAVATNGGIHLIQLGLANQVVLDPVGRRIRTLLSRVGCVGSLICHFRLESGRVHPGHELRVLEPPDVASAACIATPA